MTDVSKWGLLPCASGAFSGSGICLNAEFAKRHQQFCIHRIKQSCHARLYTHFINFNSTSLATNKICIPCRVHACCILCLFLLPSTSVLYTWNWNGGEQYTSQSSPTLPGWTSGNMHGIACLRTSYIVHGTCMHLFIYAAHVRYAWTRHNNIVAISIYSIVIKSTEHQADIYNPG